MSFAAQAMELVPGASVGATHAKVVSRAITAQIKAVLGAGALSTREKLLLLFATCAVRRLNAPARVALRHAVDLGATPEEIEELLIACFTSRGALAYFEARSIVQEVLPDASENEPAADPGESDAKGSKSEGGDILQKLAGYFGDVPLWAETIAQSHPELLEAHQTLREIVFKEGYASRKLKELVFVTINTAERYDFGIRLHSRASSAAGASQKEILEAMAVAVLVGGIPSWIEGIHHYLGDGQRY